MQKLLFMIAALTCCASFASAQDDRKIQVFGGYSYLRFDASGNVFREPGATADVSSLERFQLDGFHAQVAGYFNPHFGIAGDVSGHYERGAASQTSVYNFLGGPQVKARLGRTSPFAHALFGVSRGKGSVLTQSVVGSFDIVSSTPSEGQTKFAFAIGGGVDVNVSERIAIRALQVDYLRTSFSNNSDTRFGDHQNNLRLSVGVVFK